MEYIDHDPTLTPQKLSEISNDTSNTGPNNAKGIAKSEFGLIKK